MLVRTHTKTYAVMGAWAETTPVVRDHRQTYQGAREGDPCCAPQCGEHLRANETVYAVTELDRKDANPGRGEPWVCWRHVRPDDGPITI